MTCCLKSVFGGGGYTATGSEYRNISSSEAAHLVYRCRARPWVVDQWRVGGMTAPLLEISSPVALYLGNSLGMAIEGDRVESGAGSFSLHGLCCLLEFYLC